MWETEKDGEREPWVSRTGAGRAATLITRAARAYLLESGVVDEQKKEGRRRDPLTVSRLRLVQHLAFFAFTRGSVPITWPPLLVKQTPSAH